MGIRQLSEKIVALDRFEVEELLEKAQDSSEEVIEILEQVIEEL